MLFIIELKNLTLIPPGKGRNICVSIVYIHVDALPAITLVSFQLSLVTMANLNFTGNMCQMHMQLQPVAVEGFTCKRSKKSEKKVNFGKSNVLRQATIYCHTRLHISQLKFYIFNKVYVSQWVSLSY